MLFLNCDVYGVSPGWMSGNIYSSWCIYLRIIRLLKGCGSYCVDRVCVELVLLSGDVFVSDYQPDVSSKGYLW